VGEVVLQRRGRRNKKTVALYALEPKRPILRPRLGFIRSGLYVATRVIGDNVRAAIDYALRTAR
jgi:hypothetical protein